MWEFDYKENWVTKNWCFWTSVLEKILERSLTRKEIQPIHPKGDQSEGKDSDAGRDWGQEEKGTTEDEMAGWHHWLNGRKSEWTPMYCHPAYLTYMQNAWLDEAQAGLKIAGRNISNLRYTDDTTLMEESKEELKRL